MSSIKITNVGRFEKTKMFLEIAGDINNLKNRTKIKSIAEKGVDSLAANTPVDTGKTANSWSYEIEETKSKITIYWNNSNVINGVNIAIILEYGHGTRNGGYVQGVDYINPALANIFKDMASDMWEAVVSL